MIRRSSEGVRRELVMYCRFLHLVFVSVLRIRDKKAANHKVAAHSINTLVWCKRFCKVRLVDERQCCWQRTKAIDTPAAGRKRTPPRGFAGTRGQDEGDEGARAEQAVPGLSLIHI